MQIQRPPFTSVPLAEGLRWRGGADWCYQEKLDGRWHIREHCGSILVGELVRQAFTAFDVVVYEAQDVRQEALRVRLGLLRALGVPMVRQSLGVNNCLQNEGQGSGGEFLREVLASGGEGVVAKDLSAPFGATWFKCKRFVTLDLIVTEKDVARGSIRLSDAQSGEDRGWCPAKAQFERVSVGEMVEVKAHCISARGKLREPRFVRVRQDKVHGDDQSKFKSRTKSARLFG